VTRYLVSTDSGGTFVDAVIWDLDQRTYSIGKAPTTPEDPPAGIINAVKAAAELAGLPPAQVFANAELMCNGTTVTTNAMIERKGATTGLLTTAGFEDTISIANVIGRTIGLDETRLFDYRRAEWPEPIVPRTLVRGVVERVDSHGEVVVPLDEARAQVALDELVGAGIEALAICLLWSFKRPEHEQRLAAMARRRHPKLFVVASSELVPILREYERANTTAINAYLGRVFQRYASGMRERLHVEGHGGGLLIMQSVGGLAPASEIERLPIVTLFSGPVGGVIAGRNLGAAIGQRNVITTDMGGTSFDVGLILEGEPLSTQTTVIERQIVAIPTVDIETVGAGGGSVARINESGLLQVGPRSMGAMPGPACYGRGGATPTVTDADVVLGYIDAEHFLGGHMKISRERAEQAIRKDVAEPLGMSVVEAAAAIYEIVNARMADLIRRMTVERGHDPRDFALAAFGGCGPTHCTAFGPDIGVGTVVVPESATAFSALGISQSDLRHSWVHSFSRPLRNAGGALDTESLDELNAILVSLFERGRTQFGHDRVDPARGSISWSADLRYRNQVHEILVPMPISVPLATGDLAEVVKRFEALYEQRYGAGASSPTARIEWVNVRVDAVAPTRAQTRLAPAAKAGADPGAAKIADKPVYNLTRRRYEATPLYASERLRPGNEIHGPAVVLSYGTTIPLHDGQHLVVDAYRNYLISFDETGTALGRAAAARARKGLNHP